MKYLDDKWFGERFLKSFSTSFPICERFSLSTLDSRSSIPANPAILKTDLASPLYTQLMTIKSGKWMEGKRMMEREWEICKKQQIWFFIFRHRIFICRLRAVQDWLDLMFMQSMKNYSVMVRHLSTFCAAISISVLPQYGTVVADVAAEAGDVVTVLQKLMIGKTLKIIKEEKIWNLLTYNLIVNSRLRDERGDDERGNDSDGKMRGQSPRASPNGHSPVLNLSKSGNEHNSVGEPSERSELHSPNPSIRDDDDNISEGNVSEVDEPNDKDDEGS
jgi:hypothetical protein